MIQYKVLTAVRNDPKFMNPNLIDLYGFGLTRIASLDFVSGIRFLRMGLTLEMVCVGLFINAWVF